MDWEMLCVALDEKDSLFSVDFSTERDARDEEIVRVVD